MIDPLHDPCDVSLKVHHHHQLHSRHSQRPDLYFCGQWIKRFKLSSNQNTFHRAFHSIRSRTASRVMQLIKPDSCPTRDGQWDGMLDCFYKSCIDIKTIDELGISPLVDLLQYHLPSLIQRAKNPMLIDAESLGWSQSEKALVLSKRFATAFQQFNVHGFFFFHVNSDLRAPGGAYTLHVDEVMLLLESHSVSL